MNDIIVFHNARIFTGTESVTCADTLAISGKFIVAVGTEAEVQSEVNPEAKWVNLAGCTIVPGFIDAHCHFTVGVFADLWPDCRDGQYDRLTEIEHEGWIRGRQMSYPFNYPSLSDFDDLIPDRPAILVEQGYHGCALNSMARRVLSEGHRGKYFISLLNRPETRGTSTLTNLPYVASQRFSKSSAVFETAMGWAENVSRNWFQEKYTAELVMATSRRANRFLANGITCVCDAAVTPNMVELLKKAQTVSQLPLSVVMLVVGKNGFFEHPWDRLEDIPTGEGDEILRVGSLKLFVDGGRQCFVRSPDGKTYGLAYYSYRDMQELMTAAFRRGFSIACHAMGNAAAELVLDSYSAVWDEAPEMEHPLRIEHAALLTPSLINRMADHNVIAVVQPNWIEWLGPRWIKAPHRHLQFLPFRSLVDAGVTLAASSDSTDGSIPSPLESIAMAISRQATTNLILAKEQALTPQEALLMWTRNAALACGILDERGTLEAGKRADFVILKGDPLSSDALIDRKVRILATYVAGASVYSSDSRGWSDGRIH